MADIYPFQDSFSRGEISPRLHKRASLELYSSALSRCENFLTLPHGGIRKRAGSRFAGATKFAAKKSRVVPFIFSADQAYVLEFGDLYVRFFAYGAPVTATPQNISGITKANPAVVTYSGADTYANGDRVIISGVTGMTEVNNREFTVANVNVGAKTFELSGVNSSAYTTYSAGGTVAEIIEVTTPFTEAELSALKFAQSGDVIWIAHKDHPLQLLTRNGATSWSIAEYELDDGPYELLNDTATTLTPAGTGAIHPKMTGNSAPSGTANASDDAASAYQVFDQNNDTIWHKTSGGSDWLSYAPGSSKVMDGYWIKPYAKLPNEVPLDWVVEGFNGSAWIVLDEQAGITDWGGGAPKFFQFTNKASYSSYRISFNSSKDSISGYDNVAIAAMGWHEAGDSQTPFNLTASSTTGINGGSGFLTTDVGRTIRLLGSDGEWRWARIVSRTSSTVVTIRIYGQALPDLKPFSAWKMSVFKSGDYARAVTLFEERLGLAGRYSVHASRSFDFENFTDGEADDDAVSFTNAGSGVANDIQWIADVDGFLAIATTGGIRALAGSGYDESLTPSSFKNRNSRARGASYLEPVKAGNSLLYVPRGRKTIAELALNTSGRFESKDVCQVSEHIPKSGVVELAFQESPDAMAWFPLDSGQLGCLTYQPDQDVRGLHRHIMGGSFSGGDAVVESACVTPGQDGNDELTVVVKRTIAGATKRYIEVIGSAFEYAGVMDAFQVDCGLEYEGAATGTVTGLFHLSGQTVDVLADSKVYKGLTVTGTGSVTLPGGATAAHWIVGLPFDSEADSLQLDVGGRDGSLVGRRRRITKIILSVLETDRNGLEVTSMIKDRWTAARIPSNAGPSSAVELFTGDIEIPIDDSWAGKGQFKLRHTAPTPCTILGFSTVFDKEG